MYRMIIVDDEPTVRNGLKSLLDWSEYGFEICAEAEDGVEGLKKIIEFQPDLVMADIKMPELGGIEMIQEARNCGFTGKCVFLSGYSDFTYAKQAIKLGVEAYLLKPIDDDELTECIESMKQELIQRDMQQQYKEEAVLKAKKEILKNLLLCMEDEQSLQAKLKEYNFECKYHKFCVAVIETEKDFRTIEYNKASIEKQELFLFGVNNVEVVHLENKLVLVGLDTRQEEFRNVLQKSNMRIKQRYGEGFFIALGLEVGQWKDLHFSYESAKMLLERRFLFECEDVVTLGNCCLSGKSKQDNILDALYRAIEVGDEAEMQGLISSQMGYYRRNIIREEEIKLYFLEILSRTYHGLTEDYMEQSRNLPPITEMKRNVKQTKSLGELNDVMLDICRKLSRVIAMDSDHIINRILYYMEKHYNEDLSLKQISELFNYNSAYLGKLFKETTGEGFVSALNRLRIDRAKEMLLEKKLKVHQISEMVGYSDTSYFYSKFKEYAGVSPRDYETVNG